MPVHALRSAQKKKEKWVWSASSPSSSYPKGRVRQATAAYSSAYTLLDGLCTSQCRSFGEILTNALLCRPPQLVRLGCIFLRVFQDDKHTLPSTVLPNDFTQSNEVENRPEDGNARRANATRHVKFEANRLRKLRKNAH